jgi:hypothetical protein
MRKEDPKPAWWPDAQTLALLRQFDDLPDCAFVKWRVVALLFGGISDEELYRCTRDGSIPEPTKPLGGRTNFWRVGELRAALGQRQASVSPLPPEPPPPARKPSEGRRRHAEPAR